MVAGLRHSRLSREGLAKYSSVLSGYSDMLLQALGSRKYTGPTAVNIYPAITIPKLCCGSQDTPAETMSSGGCGVSQTWRNSPAFLSQANGQTMHLAALPTRLTSNSRPRGLLVLSSVPPSNTFVTNTYRHRRIGPSVETQPRDKICSTVTPAERQCSPSRRAEYT